MCLAIFLLCHMWQAGLGHIHLLFFWFAGVLMLIDTNTEQLRGQRLLQRLFLVHEGAVQ